MQAKTRLSELKSSNDYKLNRIKANLIKKFTLLLLLSFSNRLVETLRVYDI
jgi:hypothetical protein